MIPAGEMADGRVLFFDTTGYMFKIRMQFCGKLAPARCTQHIFRLGRVKTCVDQTAQLISRWMKMGTLLCRQMIRVHPILSFTLISTLFLFCFVWCPCMAVNASVQYNGGLLPDIILLT